MGTVRAIVSGLNKRIMGFRILGLALLLFTTQYADAQVPQKFNYQAVVRNNTGAIVGNQRVSTRFTILDGGIGGVIRYQETDTGLTNQFGLITVVIGGGNVIQGGMDSIDWSKGTYYLQVETDVTGGSNYVNMGATQLLSVPYSLFAKSAGVMALKDDSFPIINGPGTIEISPSTSYLEISSSVAPASAIMQLSNGKTSGHCIVLLGTSSGSNGIRLNNGGNLNFGSMTPSIEILNSTILMLMWNGTQWVKVSWSANQ